ncbi:hypothetical protein HHK36_005891 [Tetracentron sinense]|uniref:Uncharacterized protein n=1 Tax=Tetracentron sinense TaxID=13715 RepID=A0A834ZP64_TETSI|nr:hypothetical protein HHK36_005891 [Tetracentron sinense]
MEESKNAHIVEIPVDEEHQQKLFSAMNTLSAIQQHPLMEISESPGHLLLLKLWQREEDLFGRRIAIKETRMDNIRREIFQLCCLFLAFHGLFLTILFTSSINSEEQTCQKWWLPSCLSVSTSFFMIFLVQMKVWSFQLPNSSSAFNALGTLQNGQTESFALIDYIFDISVQCMRTMKFTFVTCVVEPFPIRIQTQKSDQHTRGLSARRCHHFSKCLSIFRRFSHSNPSFLPNPKHNLIGEAAQSSNRVNFNHRSILSDIYNCNLKIMSFGRSRKVEEARKLFDGMSHRDIVSYASMITVYLKNGDLPKAKKLFLSMPVSSIVAESAMIDGYVKANQMDEARRIFDGMPDRNVFSWTSLISGYLKFGDVGEARRLFDQIPVKNIVLWTTMVMGYARNGLIGEARNLFDRIPEKNVVAWTAMIKSYVEDYQIDEARKLFNEMPKRNLYSWNIMISGCLDNERVTEAIELFKLMPQTNAVSWTTMVSGLARNGFTVIAREYFDQMPQKDTAAWNAMITAYANDGLMIEASELFTLMPERNTVTWNAMIDGYARNSSTQEALKHLVLMLRARDRPNETTITCVLTACRSMVELMQAHTLVILLGFEPDTSLTNALVTMYSSSGDLGSARLAFENLEAKDIVSWTAMILAYSNHGYGDHVLQVFARMLRSGAKPDEITFVGVLSACSHAGLVEKGQRLFSSMSRVYGLEPNAEHYSCLVDLLGRAGHVDEAMEVVCQMPQVKRDGAVVGALLAACKLHGHIGVANRIGEELIELEPSSSGAYVLLANLYAACGKWEEFAVVRKKMKERNVKKVPGFSQIDVKNRSHVFFVGDRSHPQVKEIYAMLKEKLLPEMKEIGYL